MPEDYRATLALSGAVAAAGVRVRDTYRNEDVRHSGLRYLTPDQIWMLDLTLDVMTMLASTGTKLHDRGQIAQMLQKLSKEAGDHHWKHAVRKVSTGPAQFREPRAHIPPRGAIR